MSSTTKMQEYKCPCCGEKFCISINESGEILVAPLIIPKEDIISIGKYDFGTEGGENGE